MESLEDILKKIEEFKRDLSATIVVEEGEGHYNTVVDDPGCGGYHASGGAYREAVTHEEWVIDKPTKYVPDTQKREAARTQLQQIYDSSEWYSARYIAGKNLNVNSNELNKRMDTWISELEKKLNASKKEERLITWSNYHHHPEPGEGPNEWYAREMKDRYGTIEEEFRTLTFLLFDKRKKAIIDIERLYNFNNDERLITLLKYAYEKKRIDGLLEEVDSSGNETFLGYRKELRKIAGKALGYSNLRIWAHEHLIAATVTGIATASGLGYLLYQYLTK